MCSERYELMRFIITAIMQAHYGRQASKKGKS